MSFSLSSNHCPHGTTGNHFLTSVLYIAKVPSTPKGHSSFPFVHILPQHPFISSPVVWCPLQEVFNLTLPFCLSLHNSTFIYVLLQFPDTTQKLLSNVKNMDQFNYSYDPGRDAPYAQHNQPTPVPAQLVDILNQLSMAGSHPETSKDQLTEVIHRLTTEASQPWVTMNQLTGHLNHIIGDVLTRPADRPDAHPLAAVPQYAPGPQFAKDPLWEDLVDEQNCFRAPIQSPADAEAREAIHLARRNLEVNPPAADIPGPEDDGHRRTIAASLKTAIIRHDQVPEAGRRRNGFRHLTDLRWWDSEIDLLVWKLMDYAEAAATGQCLIPRFHEARPTPYKRFDTYQDRLRAMEAILLENKDTVESCFKNDVFCARLAWNPGKEIGRKKINAAVNDSRSKTTKTQQQAEVLPRIPDSPAEGESSAIGASHAVGGGTLSYPPNIVQHAHRPSLPVSSGQIMGAGRPVGEETPSYPPNISQHAPRPSLPFSSGQSMGSQLGGGMNQPYGSLLVSQGAPQGRGLEEPQRSDSLLPGHQWAPMNAPGAPHEMYPVSQNKATRPSKKRKTSP
ncbi:hypothetical protein F5Y18DRAFT_425523 [Xylariaceae sp. FL1019]|nr:hypothetical protein F5Y18DRAFT_425523 [Xylariaceae sp. FL1019]